MRGANESKKSLSPKGGAFDEKSEGKSNKRILNSMLNVSSRQMLKLDSARFPTSIQRISNELKSLKQY